MFAVGKSSRGDAVRDQHGAVMSSNREDEAEGLGVEMDAVGDDFGRDGGVPQADSQDARIPVVNRPHRVEEVGCVRGASRHACPRFGRGCVRVPHRGPNAVPSQLRDHRPRPGELGRQRHYPHPSLGGGEQLAQLGRVGVADPVRGLGALAFGIDVWPLHVNAKNGSAGPGADGGLHRPFQGPHELPMRHR